MAPNLRIYALAFCYVGAGLVIGIAIGLASTRSWSTVLWILLGALVAFAAAGTARELIRVEISKAPPTVSDAPGLGLISTCLSLGFLVLSFAALRVLDVKWVAVGSWCLAILISMVVRKALRLREDAQNVGTRWHLLQYARVRPLWPSKDEAVDPVGCALQLLAASTLGIIYVGLWVVIEVLIPALTSLPTRLWRRALLRSNDSEDGFAALAPVASCFLAASVTTAASWGITQVLNKHGG